MKLFTSRKMIEKLKSRAPIIIVPVFKLNLKQQLCKTAIVVFFQSCHQTLN